MNYIYNNLQFTSLRKKLRKNQTPAEIRLWSKLRNKQLFDLRFFRQYSIGSYILDFYCPQIRLAIEVDGGQHNSEALQQFDQKRTNFLNSQDIKVLRFWNNEVLQETTTVLEIINKAITPPHLPLR